MLTAAGAHIEPAYENSALSLGVCVLTVMLTSRTPNITAKMSSKTKILTSRVWKSISLMIWVTFHYTEPI